MLPYLVVLLRQRALDDDLLGSRPAALWIPFLAPSESYFLKKKIQHKQRE